MIKDYFIPTVQLSALAYQHPDVILNALNESGYENFEWIENEDYDTQCFVCSKNDLAFVVFRGSSSCADWCTNFDIALVPFKYGLIHRGFREDAMSVHTRILDSLVKHYVNQRKIIVTGHSQGAAVACASAFYIHDVYDLEAVIHYGCPRLVNTEAANVIKNRFGGIFHRFVNNNDLVTRIAPRAMGYSHFGQIHYFLEDGSYTDNISAWAMFLDRIQGKFDFGGEYCFDSLNDHDVLAYQRLTLRAFSPIKKVA